jgi:hypothetical protein
VGDDRDPSLREGTDMPGGNDEQVGLVVRQGLGGGAEMKRASPQRSPYSFALDGVEADEVDRR